MTKLIIVIQQENRLLNFIEKELQVRSEAYTKRTKQKLQKTVVTHLSAIVNFNKEHTPEYSKKYVIT